MSIDTANIPEWLIDFEAITGAQVSTDPLSYPGYAERLKVAAARSGLDESATWGTATVAGYQCVAVVFSFSFMGGSLGEATGRRVVDAIDHAVQWHMPLLTYIRSGGARIQEGLRSLLQLQTIAQALVRLRDVGLVHIAVVADPTTGGAWVSLAAVADVIIAQRGARVAFAGARARRSDAGDEAFTARAKYAGGFVDVLAEEHQLGEVVSRYARVLFKTAGGRPMPCAPPAPLGHATPAEGWAAVLNARALERPHARAYLDAYFDELVEISGDRVSGRDPMMLCGVGLRGGHPIAFVAQTGSPNNAAGFRTAVRVLDMAENLRLPVLTLVDTPGAASDAEAEAEGIGTAIGQLLAKMTRVSSPVTTLVIGEGGSGGALALCAPGNTWVTANSYFAVIAPESAAAIVNRDSSAASEVAEHLGLGPGDVVRFGVAAGVAQTT